MARGRIRALLLDLDGTLLINDMNVFLPRYFAALVARVQGKLDGARFLKSLREATQAMAMNDGRRGSNAEVFDDVFYPRIGRSRQELMPLFEAFYREDFEALRRYTEPDPQARPLVEAALAQGYQIAIATQPLFPRSAILARLRWAGVDAERYPYAAITSYETMGACKPHPLFFATLLQQLGRAPYECVMVGDSLEADMAASRFGIRTYWVDRDDQQITTGLSPDAWGSLGDLITLVQTGGIDGL